MTCDSNGDLDPWAAGGVLESPSASLVSIVIKDAAHHLDLRSSNPDDTAAVIAARRKEKAVVKRWLRQYWNRGPRPTTGQVQCDRYYYCYYYTVSQKREHQTYSQTQTLSNLNGF